MHLVFPNHVRDIVDFYGRHVELAIIQQAHSESSPNSVVIIGERRIGKTSLQTIAVELLKQEQGFLPIVVPLISAPMTSEMYLREIARSIGKEFPEIKPDEIDSIQSFIALQTFLAGLSRNGKNNKIILCIDEFDNILTAHHRINQEEEAARVISIIDNLIANRTNLPLLLNITLTKMPREINEAYNSPGFSKTTQVYLKPMPVTEMNELVIGVSGGAYEFSAEALSAIYEQTNGHPYFVKLLLTVLSYRFPHEQEPIKVSVEMVQDAASEALQDERTRYVVENIYTVHFSEKEKELALLLCEREKTTEFNLYSMGSAFLSAAKSLVQKGYFSLMEQTYSWGNRLFQSFLLDFDWYEEEVELHHIQALVDLCDARIFIDQKRHSVHVQGGLIEITEGEFGLLEILASFKGNPISREELIDRMYPGELPTDINNNAVDKTVSRLREKLGKQSIETIRGYGFRLDRAVLIGGGDE